MTVAAVGEAVDQRRVTVIGEDHRCVGCEQRIVVAIGQSVRMLGIGLEAHEVDHIDDSNLQIRQVRSEQRHGGERFERRHIAGARHHDVGLPATVIAPPVPDADAARAVARGIFDRLTDKSAMLLGAGAMGELTARHLLAQGVGSLMVANRTFERAIDVARALGGMPVPWDGLSRTLPLADLIIGAASGDDFLLGPAAMEEALRERRRRPMFVIDLAVPRAIDPGVNALDGVYLYDIDDLEGVIADNRGARAAAAAKAETIVEAEVDAFWGWFTSLDVVPTIVALREKLEALRQQELERTLSAMGDLDPKLVERQKRLALVDQVEIDVKKVFALRRHHDHMIGPHLVEQRTKAIHWIIPSSFRMALFPS